MSVGEADSPLVPGYLRVDLKNIKEVTTPFVAYVSKSRGETFPPVSLWESKNTARPNPCDYWDRVQSEEHEGVARLRISRDRFHILKSKELIAMHPVICIYCRANDETVGEMRIHYAGFVHPFFGYARKDGHAGTPLIFEVRGHSVNVNLCDGEKLCRVLFYRMSTPPKRPKKQTYGTQLLSLSKFFDDWPNEQKA